MNDPQPSTLNFPPSATHPCLRVGITGGIGSGKSTVCHIFETLGIPVFYADTQAKHLLNTDPALRAGVTAIFGPQAYTPEGEYNRPAIAQMAFGQPEKLAALNALVHPAVEVSSRHWHEQQAESGVPYTLKEAALMVESGGHQYLDFLIVVTAPESLRIQRVVQRDGITEDQVHARIRNQLPEAEKVKWADFLIQNDGAQHLIPQVVAIHQKLIQK